MTTRMNASEVRRWVTPYVMRFLLTYRAQGKTAISRQALLDGGIHEESIRALLQTRRISPVPAVEDAPTCYEITLDP